MSAVSIDPNQVEQMTQGFIARWPREWSGPSSTEKFRKIAIAVLQYASAEQEYVDKMTRLLAQPTVTIVVPGKELQIPIAVFNQERRWVHFVPAPNSENKCVFVDTHNTYFGLSTITNLIANSLKVHMGRESFKYRIDNDRSLISPANFVVKHNPVKDIDYLRLGFRLTDKNRYVTPQQLAFMETRDDIQMMCTKEAVFSRIFIT